MTKLASLSLLSVLFSATAFAQSQVHETLVGQNTVQDSMVSGFFVAPTFATTSFDGTLAYSPGIRGGVYLNRRVALGLTLNMLGTDDTYVADHEARNFGAYGGLLVQYIVHSNRVLHFNVESTIGSGSWCSRITDASDECAGKRFMVFEPVANLELNVARHLRIATGVGYRFAVGDNGTGPSDRDLGGLVARTSLVFGSF